MAEEVLGRLVNRHASGSDVFVDLALALLPPLGPEPALIGWHGQSGPQLDDPVGALRQLQLRTRLVQVQPATNVGGQRDCARRQRIRAFVP